MSFPEGYFDGLNRKLLESLPSARKIIEFGCANGRLGAAYKALHPSAHWTGVDRMRPALQVASGNLDRTIQLDLDDAFPEDFDGPFDLVVIGDLVQHLKAPLVFLSWVRGLVATDGRLVCSIPNMNHVSVVERMLIGDLSYDQTGLMDDRHLRFFSPSSAIKLLLDAGFLPSLVESDVVDGDPGIVDPLRQLARALGSSDQAFARNLLSFQMVFDCIPRRVVAPAAELPRIAVVVPVSRWTQYHLNIARSPGVAEMGAALIPVWGATSAGDAFARGRAQTSAEWILFCHQDIYLPIGSGREIAAALAATSSGHPQKYVGFIGLVEVPGQYVDGNARLRLAGTIIDRVARLDFAPADNPISIDECIVAIHVDCPEAIDPAIGWDLWATDLIWSLQRRSAEPASRVVNVAVYHNSLTGDPAVPSEASRKAMFAKHPDRNRLRTLCGTWMRPSAGEGARPAD